MWHVHGSWTTSFVRGRHTYLLPCSPEGGPWGRGRCGRPWPDSAVDVPPDRLREWPIDLVVLQRPDEIELTRRWLGARPGIDIPAVYVEHNAPGGSAASTRHVLADRDDIPLVHVTHFNEVMWDNGICPTTVIRHGVVDPGYRYSGTVPHAATMINEPVRRMRVTGTDLLAPLSSAAPVDVFGIGTDGLHTALGLSPDRVRGMGDLDLTSLHTAVAQRRVFVHTPRWTSLGLSVLEAMHLGMPIVALAATEAAATFPPEVGVVSADPAELAEAVGRFVAEPEHARTAGLSARRWVLANHGVTAFLSAWDRLLAGTCSKHAAQQFESVDSWEYTR
ncbi:glycosyltransferase [Nocardia blacklockiae]|uniref:glycosyltransferase n=1 Tax=Nocardia blacklockiae TaxID=480036 RepID=UPI002B4AFAEB|nr:glycosyltransferase [Nocardia blacklockiae]